MQLKEEYGAQPTTSTLGKVLEELSRPGSIADRQAQGGVWRSIRELSIEVGVPCYSCTGLWRGYTWSIVFRLKRKDAIKLERVQNRFMRMLPEELEPRERLRRIRLYSLQKRVRGDLIEAYKGMRGNFFHGG